MKNFVVFKMFRKCYIMGLHLWFLTSFFLSLNVVFLSTELYLECQQYEHSLNRTVTCSYMDYNTELLICSLNYFFGRKSCLYYDKKQMSLWKWKINICLNHIFIELLKKRFFNTALRNLFKNILNFNWHFKTINLFQHWQH